MTTYGSEASGGAESLDPTDRPYWTDEHGRQWRKRSAIYGKRLRKLLSSGDVRVLHWNNATGVIRDVPVDERERLRHAVERSLAESDLIESETASYAYDYKGPNHETLVIISQLRYDLPE